jgi:hypothetical protein
MPSETLIAELKGALTRLNLEGDPIDRDGIIVANLTTSSLTLSTLKQLGRIERLHVGDSNGLILSIPPPDKVTEEEDDSVQIKRHKRDGAALVHLLADLRGSEKERVTTQVVSQEVKDSKEAKLANDTKDLTTTITTRTTVAAALASEVAISVLQLIKAVGGASEGVLTVGDASFMGDVDLSYNRLRFFACL